MNQETNNKRMLPSEVKDTFKLESSLAPDEIDRVWDILGITHTSSLTGRTEAPSHFNEKDEMWARLRQRIEGENLETERDTVIAGKIKRHAPSADRGPSRPLRLIKGPRILALAATFMLLIAAGFFYWNTPVVVEAPPGEVATIALPDGSQIELNSGTKVRYKRNFGALPFAKPETRFVELDGEAYFDVQKNETPFTIETFNARIGVLGTTFNVRARMTDNNATEVVLASGRVEVSSIMHPDQHTILAEEGDLVVVAGEESAPDMPVQGDAQSAMIWRTKGFAVKGVPLKIVFAELERRFDVEITVEDQTIVTDSISINLPRPGSIETILGDICIYQNLNYRKTSRGYEIY